MAYSLLRARGVLWAPVGVWAGVIYAAGSFPLGLGGDLPGGDKFAHVLIYGVLGIFLSRAWEGSRPDGTETARGGFVRGSFVWVVVLTGVYGLLDEIHQGFLPGRQAHAFDVFADAVGGGIGAWFFAVAAPVVPSSPSASPVAPEPSTS